MATRSRSAVSGKFVRKGYAKNHPKTTVNERTGKKKGKVK